MEKNYKRIAAGNISTLAEWEEWNGSAWAAASSLPSVGDVAYANGFNSVIDQSWTVAEIRNDVFQGTALGGRFQILSAGITFSGNRVSRAPVLNAANATVLYVSFGNGTSTVMGEGTTTTTTFLNTLTIEGQSGGVLNLERTGIGHSTNTLGTVVAGNGNGFVINFLTAEAGAGSNATGLSLTGSNYAINHTGTTEFGVSNSIPIILGGSGNRFVSTGVIDGPPNAGHTSGVGLYNSGALNEVVIAGVANATAFGPAVLSLSGNFAATTLPVHSASLSSWLTLGNGATLIGTDQFAAIVGKIRVDDGAGVQWLTKSPTTADVYLYTASELTGYPLPAKVEANTVFGPSGEFTGTLSPVNVDVQQLAGQLIAQLFTNGTPWATPQVLAQQLAAALNND